MSKLIRNFKTDSLRKLKNKFQLTQKLKEYEVLISVYFPAH